MNSTLVFKSTYLKSTQKNQYQNHPNINNINTLTENSVKADTESKTVSYNEIIPDAIINEIVVTEKNSIEEYSNEYGTFPSAVVDNPWFSDHIHQHGDDPLGKHSSEIRGLCLMKWPSERLQNLPNFWNTKTFGIFSFFIPCYFIIFPNEWPWSMST